MFHPRHETMNVALERAGVGHASESRIVAAVDAIASEFFGDADNVTEEWRGEQNDTVNRPVVVDFPKQFADIATEHVS